MNQTFIYKNEQQLGPFDDSTILQQLNNGSFDYADLCWRDGWEEWRTLGSTYPKPGSSKAQPATSVQTEEQPVWEGRPSMLNYIGMWILVVVTLPIYGLGLVILLGLFWSYYSKRYVLTSKRATLVTGIIVKSSNQLRIQDIRSINLAKSGLGGLIFGIGSIELSTAATEKAEVVFSGVKNADSVRDLIAKIQG